jgi:hypothetical protein
MGCVTATRQARILRRRLARCVLVGDAYEQKGWWYLSSDDVEEISCRVVALGDEVALSMVRRRAGSGMRRS